MDKEDALLHKIEQSALRLVHTSHIRLVARGSEVSRCIHLHSSYKFEQLCDEFVALVMHLWLQLSTILFIQYTLLITSVPLTHLAQTQRKRVSLSRCVENEVRISLLALTKRPCETEDKGSMGQIRLLEHVNARNCFISSVKRVR